MKFGLELCSTNLYFPIFSSLFCSHTSNSEKVVVFFTIIAHKNQKLEIEIASSGEIFIFFLKQISRSLSSNRGKIVNYTRSEEKARRRNLKMELVQSFGLNNFQSTCRKLKNKKLKRSFLKFVCVFLSVSSSFGILFFKSARVLLGFSNIFELLG